MSEEGMKLTLVKSYLYGIAEQLELDPESYQSYDLLVDAIGLEIHNNQAKKDHEIAKFVNDLKDIATSLSHTQMLRDRISRCVLGFLRG